ncbi:hypothetical protein CFAM422_005180 [Trichoderma lentiforme]|uniref:Uncharacterized protein n=1 Tax=Trichoderma lentiforme TaxID=1567552 RepID=A0A9P4XH76_9HYPO|nr:hypothetical protein CFAM422_005180 [Trichoderma lentiforme]
MAQAGQAGWASGVCVYLYLGPRSKPRLAKRLSLIFELSISERHSISVKTIVSCYENSVEAV